MKENNNKIQLTQVRKGLISTIKSVLFGDAMTYQEAQTMNQYPNFFQMLIGSHAFGRRNLSVLVESGQTNPVVAGVIKKIVFAQSNIVFTPYKDGKPLKNAKFDFDIELATLMYIYTGTVFIHKKKIAGFTGTTLEVLNTVFVSEFNNRGNFSYRYKTKTGLDINILIDDLIIIKNSDLTNSNNSNLGLSFLQIALMPMEALSEMYTMDTATLKNKGVDGMVTNDSDDPISGHDMESFDKAFNEKIKGGKNSGKIPTSTAKLRFVQFGRSNKELALWDGYKIKLRDICNVLQVDSGQFNDPDNKKFANVEESNKALYNDCVIPFTKKITENKELTNQLGYEIYLDTSNIDCLQEEQLKRTEKAKNVQTAIIELNTQVKNGVISKEIAVNILTLEWTYNKEEANKMIMDNFVNNENTQQDENIN